MIRLRSRVWNSTLVEDFPHVDSVLVSARARLQLPPSLASQQAHPPTPRVRPSYPAR